MIHFFVDRMGSQGINTYLAGHGRPLAGAVIPMDYEELAGRSQIAAGGAIFAAVDQLSPAECTLAQAVCERLTDTGHKVLNQPVRVRNRYDLLQLLHAEKVNRFKAVRATAPYDELRYPVFIREEHQHTGAKSPLLADAFAVERALAMLALRGRPRHRLLIVEFCDTRGRDGLYRKYSAFRVSGRILPRHVHVSAQWVSKSPTSLTNDETVREEARYFETNPHEAWLRQIFELANIEYGRIDYGLANGELQVWEINTNPTLGRNPRRAPRPGSEAFRPLTEPFRAEFHRVFQDAILALDSPASPVDLPIVVSTDVHRRLATEHRTRQRRRRCDAFARKVIALAAVQRLRGILDPLIASLTRQIARRRIAR